MGCWRGFCLERGADLHMAQLMLLPLTVSCFSKIQIGSTFPVPANLGSPGKRAVKRVCVCVCVAAGFPAMRDALNRTGRQIVYSCQWPMYARYYGGKARDPRLLSRIPLAPSLERSTVLLGHPLALSFVVISCTFFVF